MLFSVENSIIPLVNIIGFEISFLPSDTSAYALRLKCNESLSSLTAKFTKSTVGKVGWLSLKRIMMWKNSAQP